ncbi:unnamed protein product, partial [marine sediment metagenome]
MRGKESRKAGINYYTDPDHKIEYSLTEVKKLFSRADFRIISLRSIVYDTPWVGFIDLIGGIALRLYKRLSLRKKEKVKNNLNESIGFRI